MQRFGRRGKLVCGLLALLPLAAAGLTLTRSVWMGTGLALLVYAVMVLGNRSRKLVLFSAVAAASLVVALKFDRLAAFEREGTAADTRSSAESRASFAYVSWRMFQDRPLLGFGFGQFPEAKLPYLDDRTTSLNLEIIRPLVHHNTYLSLLVELGLVGVVLYLAVLGLWAEYAWKLARGHCRPGWVKAHGVLLLCALATYGVQMLIHDVSFTSIDNSIIFLLAGATVGLYYSGDATRRTASRETADRRRHGDRGIERAATN
jgi:O-antigen ligase